MWKSRRAEIVEDFDREIYGRMPKNRPKVKLELISTVKDTVEQVPEITKKLVDYVDNSFYPPIIVAIQLTLTILVSVKQKVSVIIEFNSFKQPTARQLAAFSAAATELVYELLGKKGLGTAEFPAIQQTLIDGDIAYRQREGGYTSAPNWATFITYASKYFK